jgi:hypothetical protein
MRTICSTEVSVLTLSIPFMTHIQTPVGVFVLQVSWRRGGGLEELALRCRNEEHVK